MNRITIKTLEQEATQMNNENGIINSHEIGAIKIYKDICGYAIHIICNNGGGVKSIDYGMTAKECWYALNGDVQREAKRIKENGGIKENEA